MKPKRSKQSEANTKPEFAFPPHKQLGEQIQAELKAWELTGHKGAYPLPVLDFIISQIGCEIDNGDGNADFDKDAEYYNPSGYVSGITNGELFYALYATIKKMTEDEKFEFLDLSLCDQQAFASMLELAINLFLDMFDEIELRQDAVDLWILYSWCRRLDEEPIWEDENGEPVDAPELGSLTKDDWERIAEDVKEHFLGESDAEYVEMVLLDEQPHWPTFQEFRKAKAWLSEWYGHTRWNSKVDQEKSSD
jgi:hypothetical protein